MNFGVLRIRRIVKICESIKQIVLIETMHSMGNFHIASFEFVVWQIHARFSKMVALELKVWPFFCEIYSKSERLQRRTS